MDQLFKEQVWEITKFIPEGRVSTYGAIAKAVGFPNHSRHVGKAMGGCPKDVPAHRVIGSGGKLSVPKFQIKLENEGITVENFRIKNFKKYFLEPFGGDLGLIRQLRKFITFILANYWKRNFSNFSELRRSEMMVAQDLAVASKVQIVEL